MIKGKISSSTSAVSARRKSKSYRPRHSQSLPDNCHDQLARMWGSPMLPQENSLPRSKQHPARRKRNGFTRARQGHLDVTGHIVRALQRVFEMRIFFRDEPVQPRRQIPPRRRISVFHDYQTAAGMLAKNRSNAVGKTAPSKLPRNQAGDFDHARTRSANGKRSLIGGHEVKAQKRAGWRPTLRKFDLRRFQNFTSTPAPRALTRLTVS